MWPSGIRHSLRAQRGLLRSILVYYGVPGRHRQLVRFYRPLIAPGALCFDIGAHVGNRVRVWTALGARVVAVEPQPICRDFLTRWYGQNPAVTVVDQAVGAAPGVTELFVSAQTPTVTTMSRAWMDAVRTADSFAAVAWETAVPVKVTTLDALIEQFGSPVFCKIDVEGYEAEVLRGLSRPLPLLSVEYIPAALNGARDCLARLGDLGRYEYNWTVGERHHWQSPLWVTAADIETMFETLTPNSKSGDLYARLVR